MFFLRCGEVVVGRNLLGGRCGAVAQRVEARERVGGQSQAAGGGLKLPPVVVLLANRIGVTRLANDRLDLRLQLRFRSLARLPVSLVALRTAAIGIGVL